jgi:hypothetical protein
MVLVPRSLDESRIITDLDHSAFGWITFRLYQIVVEGSVLIAGSGVTAVLKQFAGAASGRTRY